MIGVDTTGGVRIPAACCGILGFRPTHGAISRAGVLPVSPSLDVVGMLRALCTYLHVYSPISWEELSVTYEWL